jgi:lysine 2,3-aminomutase
LYLRVKPYYMFQCDPSEGTEHFRTSVAESMQIQRELWGRLSGLAMANLSLDIPGGGGKVGLVPDFTTTGNANSTTFQQEVLNFSGWDGVEGDYRAPDPSSAVEPSDASQYQEEWDRLRHQSYGV